MAREYSWFLLLFIFPCEHWTTPDSVAIGVLFRSLVLFLVSFGPWDVLLSPSLSTKNERYFRHFKNLSFVVVTGPRHETGL